MATFLFLKYLRQSVKCTPSVQNYTNLLTNNNPYCSVPAARTLSTKSNSSTSNPTGSNIEEWRIIYRLPLIRLASAFNRVKIPYGILNGITIPALLALEHASQIQPPTALVISTVGVTTWCTLAISSFFIRNLIGIIYINDNSDKLKLAYIDYWGKRQDVCVDLNDVIPENEKSRPAKVDFYQSLCLYSDPKVKYKLLQRFGSIEDPAMFATIFGE